MIAVVDSRIIPNCPLPWWLVCAAAGIVLILLVIFEFKDVRQLRSRIRYLILFLSIVATVMLTGILVSPTLIREWDDPQKPRCVVLLDGSRSMLLDDVYDGDVGQWLAEHLAEDKRPADGRTARDEVVRLLLGTGPESWLAKAQGRFDVAGWRFADELAELSLGDEEAPFEVDPEGYRTAIGEVLAKFAAASGSSRPRAIVLFSDGASNKGKDPATVATFLSRLNAPVYVVGIGDPDPPADVAVESLKGPQKPVLPGGEVLLKAEIVARNLPPTRVAIELLRGGEVVERKEPLLVPSRGDDEKRSSAQVEFSFWPPGPGTYRLTARVPKLEGEEEEGNNAQSVTVQVSERDIRILLIDAVPRWEFRFLRNVLERDPAVKLTVCLLRPGIGPIAGEGYLSKLPTDKSGLDAYDIVILGDVPRRHLKDEFLKALARRVEYEDLALIIVAGRGGHYRRLAASPLKGVLPVSLEGVASARPRGERPFRIECTPEGAGHLLTRLHPEVKDNVKLWARLPKLRWSAPVAALTRGADALLVHPSRRAGGSKLPLLAVQELLTGKVMFSGMDGTWRWREAVGDKHHYRFWAQAVRWMVRRPFREGDDRVLIAIPRLESVIGDSVPIKVTCRDPRASVEGASVLAVYRHESGETGQVSLQPAVEDRRRFQGVFTPRRPGKYELRPVVSIYGREPLPFKVTLTVQRGDQEKSAIGQDRATLKDVARNSGGAYLTIDQADETLPGLLEARAEIRRLTAEYSPCRHWAYYTALALILALAWFIRKRSGLA